MGKMTYLNFEEKRKINEMSGVNHASYQQPEDYNKRTARLE